MDLFFKPDVAKIKRRKLYIEYAREEDMDKSSGKSMRKTEVQELG
jgi:hypothetical protein